MPELSADRPRTKRPGVFLSYSRRDSARASVLEAGLKAQGLQVWRDAQSIRAGAHWFEAIEEGVRRARAVVVLVTETSARSEWVTYEYGLAKGARVPVIAVVTRGAKVPDPVRQFQIVQYSGAGSAAKKIYEGIRDQSRSIGRDRAAIPTLVAKFQEVNGEIATASDGRIPALWMDLWIEGAPSRTRSVTFEIADLGFKDPKWTVRRTKRATASSREFLTDEMNSYGDVEIWVRGVGAGVGNWSTTSTLYEALVRYYRGRSTSAEIRRALRQIREN